MVSLWGPYEVLMGSLWGYGYLGGLYGVTMGSLWGQLQPYWDQQPYRAGRGGGERYGMARGSLWGYEVLMGSLWGPYGAMGFLWCPYGVLMGPLWGPYGVPMGLWGPYGVPMGSLWGPYEVLMVSLWGYGVLMVPLWGYEVLMVSLWGYGVLMVSLWGPCGFPMCAAVLPQVSLSLGGAVALRGSVGSLRALWEETSFQLERLQTEPRCVAEEEKALRRRQGAHFSVSFPLTAGPPPHVGLALGLGFG